MRSRRGVALIACIGSCFAGAHLSQGQEATSASLPDQFQTGEMIQIQKPKKKKTESISQTVATVSKQQTAPAPEQMPVAEEASTHLAPAEEKKAEASPTTPSMPRSQKPTTPTEETPAVEEPAVVAEPSEKKTRPRKRRQTVMQQRAPTISAPVSMSLSVAQSMAITAPLPGYTYQIKRRNLSGNGVCVVTVDPATGAVTNADMFQSTGSPVLDKLTTQTFKSWRFKPGAVSQVRIPISYE
jgi:TonB family protein